MDPNQPESNSVVLKNLQAFLSGKSSYNGNRRSSNGTGRSPIRSRPSHSPNTVSMDDVKRNRSANYSSLEKDIFLSAVQPYKHILEDKRFDSETLLRKTAAWIDIVSVFNSQHGVVRRDRKQLKELWKRLKDRARKSSSSVSTPSAGTPNGTSPSQAPRVINITTATNGHGSIMRASSPAPMTVDMDESQQCVWSKYPSLHALALASAAQDRLDVNGRETKSSFDDEYDEDQGLSPAVSPNPQQAISYSKKARKEKFEGEGVRHSSRELTPECEDRKPVIPTPPPLKADHGLHSPPPQQSAHPLGMHSGMGVRGNAGPLLGSTNTPPPPSKPESVPQQLLCVRWGNYDSNIVSMFSKLRAQEHFVDVTLWCEGRTIKCHKMVLSACSTYFERLLIENPNNNPIIFLKDMRLWEIEALVEFMYKGETSIHQDKLQSLLRAAESLQIKGLGSPSNNNSANGSNNNHNPSTPAHHHHAHPQQGMHGSPRTRTDLSGSHASSNDEELSNSMDMSVGNLSMSNHHAHPGLSSALLSNSHQNQNMNMGMDLSNHSSSNHLSSLHGPGGHQPLPAKRRKKETPRRIDTLPRLNHPHVPHPNPLLPLFAGVTAMRVDDEDGLSDDDESMIIQERNHLDTVKTEHSASDQNYDDSNDGDPEHFPDNDQGHQSIDEEEDSNGPSGDMDDEELSAGIAGSMGLGGLTDLRIGLSNSIGGMNLVSSERDGERERSRKGNPIKKIHIGIGNNNNNNDTGGVPPVLSHHAAID